MITLEHMVHREQRCVAIRGGFESFANSVIRNYPQRKYSSTMRCWYIVYDPIQFEELVRRLKEIDKVEIKSSFYPVRMDPVMVKCQIPKITIPSAYRDTLIRLRYSEATVKNYIIQFRVFLEFIHPKRADEITEEDIHRYLLHLIEDKKRSITTQNQAINSIKFYLEQVMKGERKVYYVERPRKEWKLPTVLSQEEVQALLWSTSNVKHRCIMNMIYSSGLRMSELLRLKWQDIDSDRKMILIRGAKGKKDRVSLLSSVAYDYLCYYINIYKPQYFLFEGQNGGAYSSRSVNCIIKNGAKKAGIVKNISAHTLRHSFATHLLEHGTDLRYIQALLGHESSRTTEKYAHVTKKGFEKLISPLDYLSGKLILDNRGI